MPARGRPGQARTSGTGLRASGGRRTPSGSEPGEWSRSCDPTEHRSTPLNRQLSLSASEWTVSQKFARVKKHSPSAKNHRCNGLLIVLCFPFSETTPGTVHSFFDPGAIWRLWQGVFWLSPARTAQPGREGDGGAPIGAGAEAPVFTPPNVVRQTVGLRTCWTAAKMFWFDGFECSNTRTEIKVRQTVFGNKRM